jgi:hypothetical protein
MILRFLFAFIFLVSFSLFAQEKNLTSPLEPSTELLLNKSSKKSQTKMPIESSNRYKVKKLPSKKVKSTESQIGQNPPQESSNTVNIYLVPDTNTKKKDIKEKDSLVSDVFGTIKESKENANAKAVPNETSLPDNKTPEVKLLEVKGLESPTVLTESEAIILAEATSNPDPEIQSIQEYVEQIHPDDVRLNQAEVTISSGLIMNDSKSNYSYRGYSSSSPHLSFQGHFWLSPFLGFYGRYLNSMGADMTSNPATDSKVVAQHELTDLGLDIRKHYGMSRKAKSLSYGIFLSEYKLTVPGDSMYRIKLRSTGIGFHMQSRWPVSPSYSWTLGGHVIPRMQANEIATGIDVSSGSLGESSRFGLNFGGEFKLTRQNQIIWSLEALIEKNQYNDQANLVDPETNASPRGVGVENRFLILNFGYRWGQ